MRAALALLTLWAVFPPLRTQAADVDVLADLAARYAREVDTRLNIPTDEQRVYAERLRTALSTAAVSEGEAQFYLLVDRSPVVQAALIYWFSPTAGWRFIGASPVSTGVAGGYEYFITPVGVFEHTPAHMDFRAEGTRNALGVRGYGLRGMRVYDFGWVQAKRTWDARGKSLMRLQVHATDPDLLEHQLGRPRSKGCIRIPATLNTFVDRYGLLDAAYEEAVRQGRRLWVLRVDRQVAASAGRYLVIVDSGRNERPAWSPWPPQRNKNSVRSN